MKKKIITSIIAAGLTLLLMVLIGVPFNEPLAAILSAVAFLVLVEAIWDKIVEKSKWTYITFAKIITGFVTVVFIACGLVMNSSNLLIWGAAFAAAFVVVWIVGAYLFPKEKKTTD